MKVLHQRDYNIDIIFKPVHSILLPTTLNGVEISHVNSAIDDDDLLSRFGFKHRDDYKIFSIKDADNKIYYVNAMAFGIYHNQLDITKSSIEHFLLDNQGDCILWYNGK
jgi:hypothetical protein